MNIIVKKNITKYLTIIYYYTALDKTLKRLLNNILKLNKIFFFI